MKQMPEDVATTLTQVERIHAHVQNEYELLPEDVEYHDLISAAFKLTHNEDRENAPKKLRMAYKHLSRSESSRIIADMTYVWGDCFLISRTAMRAIQERRHERVYEQAMAAGEYAAAERALRAIDELHHLYDLRDTLPATERKLPIMRRTADPAALRKTAEADD